RPDIRSPAAKLNESFESVAAAAPGQNGIEETVRRPAVEHTLFLESRESVRGEDFRPFVTVVPRSVAARKNVTEAVGEPIPVRHRNGGDLLAHLLQHLHYAPTSREVVFRMQAEIK